jgi:DNA-binding MarR family transcriptional regulator
MTLLPCPGTGALVSVKWIEAAFKVDVTPSQKLVLLVLANHADHDGHNAWPSVRTMCSKSSLSERSVHRTLRELRDCGLIVCDES